MEYIKIAKVNNVILHKKGVPIKGILHLTTHHLIFSNDINKKEFWFSYPMILNVFKNKGSALVSKTLIYNDDHDNNDKNTENKHTENNTSNGIIDQETVNWFNDVDLWALTNIKIIGKDYTVFSLDFINPREASDVFDSILKLTVLNDVSQLYAYIYTPTNLELCLPTDSWCIYDIVNEFERQGLNLSSNQCPWRISNINHDFKFSSSYPNKIVVPRDISDTLLTHASKYRSKARIPVLCYYNKRTNCSISRAAQPLPGIIKQRSIQDEKLVSEIFHCSNIYEPSSLTKYDDHSYHCKNIIVDARPMANALAQTALGGGTEPMDNYNFEKTTKRMFLGIDNIHVMSDTMSIFLDDILMDTDVNNNVNSSMISKRALHWIKSIKIILTSVDKLVKSMIFNQSNLLIHCSDGWDRTSQICSLIQVCIDPFYRTFDGFMILIEKDWVSFGHKFMERSGHLSSSEVFHDNTTNFTSNFTNNIPSYNNTSENDLNDLMLDSTNNILTSELINKVSSRLSKKTKKSKRLNFTSPIFQQFLDCVYQLLIQNPGKFEINERFLRRLVYHLYSCQYGTFLFDCQRDVILNKTMEKTRSVWDYFRSRRKEFINKDYIKTTDHEENIINIGGNVECEYENKEEEEDVALTENFQDYIQVDLDKVKWWYQLYGRKDREMNSKLVPDSSHKVMNNAVNTNDISCHINEINCVDETSNDENNIINTTREIFSSLNIFGKK